MPLFQNGKRSKGTFIVAQSQYNSGGDYNEYQLLTLTNSELFEEGAWFRERLLRSERRG